MDNLHKIANDAALFTADPATGEIVGVLHNGREIPTKQLAHLKQGLVMFGVPFDSINLALMLAAHDDMEKVLQKKREMGGIKDEDIVEALSSIAENIKQILRNARSE